MSEVYAIVLAAGHGKRMKSSLPKVMHQVAGRPILYYPIAAALEAGATRAVVVVGHEREQVVPYLASSFCDRVIVAVQHEQNGTGHAAAQALPDLPTTADRVLILCGDTPLLRYEDLRSLIALLDAHPNSPLAMLTCTVADPTGYGRIIRDNAGRLTEIREHRDLESDAQRAIREVNPGVYCARTAFLREALTKLDSNNAQGEQYLTDIVGIASKIGGTVDVSADAGSLVGVNDRVQLSTSETAMQARIIEKLQRSGVTIRDGATVHDTVQVFPDATIDNCAVLRGSSLVESGAVIGVGCVVDNTFVEKNAKLLPYTVVADSRIEAGAVVGPFAHIVAQA
ncbi:MAG: NTP transferase domain-containing protein [Polyangiaceae bacterium]|nr:NTP transferase domain-containing protein [Polyangiaceae bacterium]